MSVYQRPGSSVYSYEFVLNGKRYRGTTKLTRRRGVGKEWGAEDFERTLRAACVRFGVAPGDLEQCPECGQWFDARNAQACSDECATKQEKRNPPAAAVAFREQAEIWLKQLQARNRRPIPETSVPSIRAALDNWLLPNLGDMPLAEVGNAALHGLVQKMIGKLAPKSINTYVNMAKGIVESLLDADGEPVHKRTWNNNLIDLPLINKREQHRPTLEAAEISALIASCNAEWERVLYILCAATGLRIAEALGLHIGNHIAADGSLVRVRSQVKGNKVVEYLKTGAAWRDIDLCPEMAGLLLKYIGDRKGLLFPSKTGKTPMTYSNVRRRSLHPKLLKLGLYTDGAGAHVLRRFRSAELRKHGCPEDLRKYWLGHENSDISDHYAEQLLFDMKRRREWAARVGLGFEVAQGPHTFHHSNQIANREISEGSSLIN